MKYGNYTIDENGDSLITKLICDIRPQSKVIEFGSSYGYILQYLKDNRQCHVQGFEIDEKAVELAQKNKIATTLIDLDTINAEFVEQLDPDIDYIICADILEHLKNTVSFIKHIASYMKRNRKCSLLVSYPNITYYGVIDNLLRGTFKYSDLGILDSTHLHFFDKMELERIFNTLNLEYIATDDVILHPAESEFKVELNDEIIKILNSLGNNDYLSYQYVLKLRYSDNPAVVHFKQEQKQPPENGVWKKQKKLIDNLKDTINHRDNDISELKTGLDKFNAILKHRDSDINELNKAICDKDSYIAMSDNTLNKRNTEIKSLITKLLKKDNNIARLNTIINELNKAIRDKDSYISTSDNTRNKQNTEIRNLITKLSKKDNNIARLNTIVTEQTRHTTELLAELDTQIIHSTNARDAAIQQFLEIKNSRSWKLTSPLRFVNRLLQGNFALAVSMLKEAVKRLSPEPVKQLITQTLEKISVKTDIISISSACKDAWKQIVKERCQLTQNDLFTIPLYAPKLFKCPLVDISIVTYNSSRWIPGFIASLLAIDYPKERIALFFVDNSSTDTTLTDLHSQTRQLKKAGFSVSISQQPNNGYGAGHNAALSKGNAKFCLVTNIDITFAKNALRQISAVAKSDNKKVAAWELRQKPYEHPKFYDPVTGLTNWNSHACVLLRRSALEKIGWYDTSLFMYGEDIELSYRLRRAGYLLRYCPQAAVWHYCYECENQVKPLQYIGSTYANLYIRLKYGTLRDVKAIPYLAWRLLTSREVFQGSKKAVFKSMLKLLLFTPKTLIARRHSHAHFPFNGWDYDFTREGAFVEQKKLPQNPSLVSVITRTYRGRELYLRQALLSVAQQTYPNIEHIVVEDGGETMRSVVDNISSKNCTNVIFIQAEKLGRAAVGNIGLKAAKGRWCLFLDDDDLLFADHIELLVSTLLDDKDAAAAYSPALEVKTGTELLTKGEYTEHSNEVFPVLRQEFDRDVLMRYNYITIQSILFEYRLFDQYGGFEEDMDVLEDWVLWKKYARNSSFHYVAKVTSLYRTPHNQVERKKRQHTLDAANPIAMVR